MVNWPAQTIQFAMLEPRLELGFPDSIIIMWLHLLIAYYGHWVHVQKYVQCSHITFAFALSKFNQSTRKCEWEQETI